MNSRVAAVTLTALLLAATSSCGARTDTTRAGAAEAGASSGTFAMDPPSPTAGKPGARERTLSDADLARTFVAFAVHPTRRRAAVVPFAPAVRLGLSRD